MQSKSTTLNDQPIKTNQKDSKAVKKPDSSEKRGHKKASPKQAVNSKTKMPKIQEEKISD